MRITQGMMKSQTVMSQLKAKNVVNSSKKNKTPLQKLMDQKKKVEKQLKNLGKKDISSSEKTKLMKQLSEQLKKIDESIKLSKEKEKKKPVDKKREVVNSKLRVAEIRSEAFNIMISGSKQTNRFDNDMFNNIKNINQVIAMKKVKAYQKTS